MFVRNLTTPVTRLKRIHPPENVKSKDLKKKLQHVDILKTNGIYLVCIAFSKLKSFDIFKAVGNFLECKPYTKHKCRLKA